ncbi:MAG TPA: amidohydrolase family protein, partial [Steroidobacteraceae bacterium]|nr:amidohydrolase family protein [Steroidobacteraceae bacterium]
VPQQMAVDTFGPVEEAEVADAHDARAATKKLLDSGVDGIKMYAMTYPQFAMAEETMAAAVDEAHGRGKLVFAHPTLAAGLLRAVNAGADVIVHTTPITGPWNDTLLDAMKSKDVSVIPTLKLWRYETRDAPPALQRNLTNNGIAQLKAWVGKGGTVLFGTDVGYMLDYDTSEEFKYMADAGMDHRQMLASLTTAPALRFGDGQRLGKAAVGLIGDLVVLKGNPAQSIDAFTAVEYTIRDGRVIYQAK